MVALMLLLSTETTTEEKMNMCMDDTTPPTTEDHKSFKRIWNCTSRHFIISKTVKMRQEDLKWKGVIESLASD